MAYETGAWCVVGSVPGCALHEWCGMLTAGMPLLGSWAPGCMHYACTDVAHAPRMRLTCCGAGGPSTAEGHTVGARPLRCPLPKGSQGVQGWGWGWRRVRLLHCWPGVRCCEGGCCLAGAGASWLATAAVSVCIPLQQVRLVNKLSCLILQVAAALKIPSDPSNFPGCRQPQQSTTNNN